MRAIISFRRPLIYSARKRQYAFLRQHSYSVRVYDLRLPSIFLHRYKCIVYVEIQGIFETGKYSYCYVSSLAIVRGHC